MVKFINGIAKAILVVLVLLLLWMNYALYDSPSFKEQSGAEVNVDVYRQLTFLERRLKAGEGQKMQRIFPEGFVFINVLYGLAWTNVLDDVDADTELYLKGIAEVDWALSELESETGKQIFTADLPLPYGAYYYGWTTYLLGRKLSVQPKALVDSTDVLQFRQNCRIISEALDRSALPYLESYRGQIWPADIMTSIAALKIHDALFEELYSANISAWVTQVKDHLDPETGLIPHSVGNTYVITYGPARGSSQSLILTFLFEIDELFAKDQYQRYKELFVTSKFGLPGIREYPMGTEGFGDIDSGPVILEVGGAASIVGQRLAGIAKDWDTYEGLRNAIEMFGVAYTWGEEKKYILGELPMVDAFTAWSNSMETSSMYAEARFNWRWKFQLLTLGLAAVLLLLLSRK